MQHFNYASFVIAGHKLKSRIFGYNSFLVHLSLCNYFCFGGLPIVLTKSKSYTDFDCMQQTEPYP